MARKPTKGNKQPQDNMMWCTCTICVGKKGQAGDLLVSSTWYRHGNRKRPGAAISRGNPGTSDASLPLQQQPPPPSDTIQSDCHGPSNRPNSPDPWSQHDDRSYRTRSNEYIPLFSNYVAPMDDINIVPAPEPFVSGESMYANVSVRSMCCYELITDYT